MAAAPLRLRFAPSPTGSLHLGNARTALFNWLLARHSGGTMVLRIEDTDTAREQAGAEQGIYDDLSWLGLDWDEGPDVGGAYGPYRQSERGERYREAARRLLEAGRAYADFSTEAQLAEEREAARTATPAELRARRRRPDDEQAERLAAGEAHVVRFLTAEQGGEGDVVFEDRLRGEVRFPLSELSDPVIVRSDGRPTYNFAVVVDDAEMKIDLVLRGDDHLSNTPRQVLMFQALGFAVPQFAHLPMVRGEDGSKLSKRHGAVSVGEFRDAGYPREGLVNGLALLGWSADGERTVMGLEEIVEAFSLDRVGRSAAMFDREKIDWICAQHVQRLETATLAQRLGPWLVRAGQLGEGDLAKLSTWLEQAAELAREGLSRMDAAPTRLAGLFAAGGEPADHDAAEMLQSEAGRAVVAALHHAVAEEPIQDLDGWRRTKKTIQVASGQKGKALFQSIRSTLMGTCHGPDLERSLELVLQGSRLVPQRVATLEQRIARTAEWLG